MRKARWIVAGLLVGWLILGTGAGLLVDMVGSTAHIDEQTLFGSWV